MKYSPCVSFMLQLHCCVSSEVTSWQLKHQVSNFSVCSNVMWDNISVLTSTQNEGKRFLSIQKLWHLRIFSLIWSYSTDLLNVFWKHVLKQIVLKHGSGNTIQMFQEATQKDAKRFKEEEKKRWKESRGNSVKFVHPQD